MRPSYSVRSPPQAQASLVPPVQAHVHRDPTAFDEGDWEPCDLVWAEKCVTHAPAPNGKDILTDSELRRLHWQKRCPCFVKDYGGDLHRWCTWKYHFEGVRVRRGVKGEVDGMDDESSLV
jgi:hypothetical protein